MNSNFGVKMCISHISFFPFCNFDKFIQNILSTLRCVSSCGLIKGRLSQKQQTLRSPYPTQKVHQEVPPARAETCQSDYDPEAPLARVNTTADLS